MSAPRESSAIVKDSPARTGAFNGAFATACSGLALAVSAAAMVTDALTRNSAIAGYCSVLIALAAGSSLTLAVQLFQQWKRVRHTSAT